MLESCYSGRLEGPAGGSSSHATANCTFAFLDGFLRSATDLGFCIRPVVLWFGHRHPWDSVSTQRRPLYHSGDPCRSHLGIDLPRGAVAEHLVLGDMPSSRCQPTACRMVREVDRAGNFLLLNRSWYQKTLSCSHICFQKHLLRTLGYQHRLANDTCPNSRGLMLPKA